MVAAISAATWPLWLARCMSKSRAFFAPYIYCNRIGLSNLEFKSFWYISSINNAKPCAQLPLISILFLPVIWSWALARWIDRHECKWIRLKFDSGATAIHLWLHSNSFRSRRIPQSLDNSLGQVTRHHHQDRSKYQIPRRKTRSGACAPYACAWRHVYDDTCIKI